jgi:hypothetical protein
MKTEKDIWKRLYRETGRIAHWTRIEARVGAGIPDINGAFLWPPQGQQSPIEIWVELKVCRTKQYKTAGLWRPAQIAWQTARSRVSPCVWNIVSHPQSESIMIYEGSRIADIWDDETGNIEANQILSWDSPLAMFLDMAAARALDAIRPMHQTHSSPARASDSRAFDPIADALTRM